MGKKIKAAKKTAGKIAKSASAKKNALAMKKAGKGIFAKKVLSPALAAICGAKSLPRTAVTKKIWVYIKSHKLNEGRVIKPDSALKKIFPVASLDMLKMAGYVSKHLSWVRFRASETRSPARGGGDAPAMYSGGLVTV